MRQVRWDLLPQLPMDHRTDEAWYIDHEYPWFTRSCAFDHAMGAGVFAYKNDYGRAVQWISFRVVLSM